jgi:hypothetical protein
LIQTVGLISVGVAHAATQRATPLGARHADPTFAEDVAPVFYRNCTTCHHDGGMAPFTLTRYDSARAHADDIEGAVQQRVMPPWHADAPHGVFSNDRRLSDDERNTILRWIASGAKPGDLTKQPPAPDYSAKWSIGEPDLVATMKESFDVPASGKVDYQYFQIPVDITEDKWVQAIEIMPAAREVVHHVLVYAYVPPAPRPATTPAPAPAGAPAAATPRPQPTLIRNLRDTINDDPPRTDPHAPPKNMGVLIGTYVPGTSVIRFPEGTALRLRPHTVLTFQMHYTAHGHAMTDRTGVGFKFANAAPAEEIFANAFFNGQFTIPAGQKDVAIPAELGFGRAIRIWGLMPHTHLRGTKWEYRLETPDSGSRVVLSVPKYDFNWQTYYMFAKPVDVPAGSKLRSMAWYDNSATNKFNPDPKADVHWGDQTWEEMQYTGILYSVRR